MARQADRLAKIGQEGFAAIDEHFGRAKRRPPVMKVPYAHPAYYYVHQANQIPATKLIDSNEAAQRYKGRVYIDYPKGNQFRFKRPIDQSLTFLVCITSSSTCVTFSPVRYSPSAKRRRGEAART
ncbi:hypothetical protein POTOM_060367 [Populus tomentosa]|uniref:Uncharacterized protein n=1 Tax=Populus tomentosa TaxID=118781 RepID=A0A8X7XS24_POPTO|nr:hypothetical protein POTOM_060367 [Populus tomentosa]